ncbi:MAG: serine/threonine-protein kinase, partial [Burkholderiaceae bacterium]
MSHPERLGKYTITGVLGDGAMGVVYTGFDAGIQRRVALKTIHKKLIDDDKQSESIAARFRNEAQAVGRLLHPGIVAIYEYGEDETTAFIAMEYVEGRNLAQVLGKTRLLPEPELLRIMDQLLDALDCAHNHQVWHRDIKPANLIITATGQLKVADFGIARIENRALTQVDSIIGTPGYMAPEQYVGEAIDHRVDIFAAGVLLYRLLSGEAPFT